MKKFIIILLLVPLCSEAQIYDHHMVFSDSTEYRDFNQGFLDSQIYFRGTGDYFIGVASAPAYFVPAVICYSIPPKDKRFINLQNPNNDYLYSNVDYYQGYRHGATKKKRKRLLQGALTPVGITAGILVAVITAISH